MTVPVVDDEDIPKLPQVMAERFEPGAAITCSIKASVSGGKEVCCATIRYITIGPITMRRLGIPK